MATNQGTIVLMGSGEMTATMVELHKGRLRPYGSAVKAVFLDTPAGFQLNVDQISHGAVTYFKQRVQQELQVASFKSAREDGALEREQALATLRGADYILIGPGSPTYAVQQWRQSIIPALLTGHIEKGGCLVAASAAALTMGRLTLPVYEIYKVGQAVHWIEGLDLLGHFGMNLVVFPHWNNAEGGNHDTRYCFMGQPRLKMLEELMPIDAQILGLDEHTALVIDLAQRSASVYGLGRVTLRKAGRERHFAKGDHLSFAMLQGQWERHDAPMPDKTRPSAKVPGQRQPVDQVWQTLHGLAERLRCAFDEGHGDQAGAHLLEMERRIWQARDILEEHDNLGAARELFRDMVALVAAQIADRPTDRRGCLDALVVPLLELRRQLRRQGKYAEADALRDCLLQADIIVEDTPDGTRWVLK
jgi:peptidase E